jgi:hypothetical protein
MTRDEIAIIRADVARLCEELRALRQAIERMQPPKPREPGGDEVRG